MPENTVDESELVVMAPAGTLADYRRMQYWVALHSKSTRLALIAGAALTAGGLVTATLASGGLASVGFDLCAGGILMLAYCLIVLFVLAPAKARKWAKTSGPCTYTFSSAGVAFESRHGNGSMKWTMFSGYARRPESLHLIVRANGGVVLLPRAAVTTEGWASLGRRVAKYLPEVASL